MLAIGPLMFGLFSDGIAQFNTGTKTVNGTIQMNVTYLEHEWISTVLSLTPSFGYFVYPNFQIFAALNTEYFWFKDTRITYDQLGVGAKIFKELPVVSLYAGASFYANSIEIPDQAVLEIGAVTPLNKSVWLDFGIDYQFPLDQGDLRNLTIGAGIAVFIQ